MQKERTLALFIIALPLAITCRAQVAITEYTISTDQRYLADDIVVGSDGNLWFLEGGVKIAKMTPAGVVVGVFPGPSGGTDNLAAGADGNVWFTDTRGNGIGKITPAGAITMFPIPSAFTLPSGITAGPDGNVWFTEWRTNSIGRLDLTTGIMTEFPVPSGIRRY